MRQATNRVTGLARWRQLLHKPEHWKPYHSAWAMAHSWNEAKGLPPEIASMMGDCAKLTSMEPEHPVSMPGRGGPSWCNVFALVEIGMEKCALVVESSVDEPFGPLIGEWMKGNSRYSGSADNRKRRLEGICNELGLEYPPDSDIRYQFFHKSLAAVRRAKHLNTDMAAMVIQSFSKRRSGFDDFEKYCALFGKNIEVGKLTQAFTSNDIPLFLGWVESPRKFTL